MPTRVVDDAGDGACMHEAALLRKFRAEWQRDLHLTLGDMNKAGTQGAHQPLGGEAGLHAVEAGHRREVALLTADDQGYSPLRNTSYPWLCEA
nr:putative integron gene cassette protein [uncultured bacterium]